MSNSSIKRKLAAMFAMGGRCVIVSDTDPASHEFLSDSLGLIDQTQFKEKLYASTDA